MQDRVTAGIWPAATEDPETRAIVVGSRSLPAEKRLGIYASSYVARLAECMRAEFPILRQLIGEQVFNLFVGGYLSACPPASFSLYRLGAGFAEYLEVTRPKPHSGPGTPEALPASLARLERAMADADRAEGPENKAPDPTSFGAISILSDPGSHLPVPESVKLLRLDFDFTETLLSARRGEPPTLPVPKDTLVAVARARYRVQAHQLESWAFAWLAALAENGGDVRAAIDVAAQESGRNRERVLADLLVWLPAAMERGLVTCSQ